MGGFGSGRHGVGPKKHTTGEYIAIDVRRWNRRGLLEPGREFQTSWASLGKPAASIHVRTESNRVILTYRHRRGSAEWNDECYPIYLDWTACNLGGHRPWFLCPTTGCNRRVAILYGGEIFACRHCRQLVYPSQREPEFERAARRTDGIREKLGWELGVLNGEGSKPKGMHWSTYERLTAQHRDLEQTFLAGVAAYLRSLE